MGIFGGEKYSKEGYEKAKKQQNITYETAVNLPRLGDMEISEFPKIYKELLDASVKASKKAEELYAKGQIEAAALNEEYGRLLAEAQEAIKTVADFEREKLGMHKEGAEETDADKK
jgi:hypothetical protein